MNGSTGVGQSRRMAAPEDGSTGGLRRWRLEALEDDGNGK